MITKTPSLTQNKKRKSPKPHWYKLYIGECPVCGRDASFRERVTDVKRPDKLEDRIEYLPETQTYCHCMG